MRAAIVGALISAALAGAARTPGEQLHYAFASVGCSAGSGTFPDLVHPTASLLTTINEVARNLGGSEAKGQRCFDNHVGVILNQSTVADGDDYEPLESKPGDNADFNDGLTDGFTIELWLTPMDTDSSSDQVLVALEQRDPGATSIVCAGDSDCPDNNCACRNDGKFGSGDDAGQCFPGFEGTCDLLACTNAADGKVGFRLLQSKKNRGRGDKGELTLEYKFSEDGASNCNRFPEDVGVLGVLGMVGDASDYGLDLLEEGGSLPTPQHVVISVNGNLAEPGPELLSTLTMPLPFHVPTKKGSGLVLAKDEKGEDVYVPDPQSSRLCEELVALEGVPNPEALWLLVRDVPGHILVPKLSAAIAYQKSAPKGDFCQYFLDTLVPQVEEAIKAATDLSSASKAMSDVSHLGVHLGGGYSQTVDLLDNKSLNVIPGVMVCHLAVGRRGDLHNSFARGRNKCKTGVAIVESLRRVYAAAGYLPEIVLVQESWALNGCDMLGVHRSVKDDVVTYIVRVRPLYVSSTCASLHAVDATGSSHAGTPSTSRSARSTRWRLRYGERCGRRPRAST